jgi:hypothetical protein
MISQLIKLAPIICSTLKILLNKKEDTKVLRGTRPKPKSEQLRELNIFHIKNLFRKTLRDKTCQGKKSTKQPTTNAWKN